MYIESIRISDEYETSDLSIQGFIMFAYRTKKKKNGIYASIDLVYLSGKSYFSKYQHTNILLTKQ